MKKTKIDVILPIFNEEKNLLNLYSRLERVFLVKPEISWGYIFVNDGSPDDSMSVLRDLASKDLKIKVINLSRNFGKEVALSAGLHASSADAVICLDADLQHPPEVILEMVNYWTAGAEIVIGVRSGYDQPIFKRLGSNGYYWIMKKISGLNMVPQTTDYRLLDKKVVTIFNSFTERNRMFRGIVDWMGFEKAYVKFHAPARLQGEPGYSYSKLWKLAIQSITAFSLWPLQLTGYLGFLITFISGLLALFMSITYLIGNSFSFTPLAFVMVVNTFLIGIVLMAIGMVALYIGTIHSEVINRPLYIERDRLNFAQENKIEP
jgi:glycosyltransferase involved in cell wall biosynthesis